MTHKLNNSLAAMVMVDDIQAALGIVDRTSMPEEFWKIQYYTAKDRYWRYLLHRAGFDVAKQFEDLPDFHLDELWEISEKIHRMGITYKNVREWWLTGGSFIVDKAIKLRKERDLTSSKFLSVLFIFEKGAKWLSYDEGGNVVLVENKIEAWCFDVKSISELSKSYIEEMAKHFEVLAKQLYAKSVKVLPN